MEGASVGYRGQSYWARPEMSTSVTSVCRHDWQDICEVEERGYPQSQPDHVVHATLGSEW